MPPVTAIFRCFMPIKRPMPCCSCTTKSPGFNSIKSIALRLRFGVFNCVAVEDLPVKSRSVSTAIFAALSINPSEILDFNVVKLCTPVEYIARLKRASVPDAAEVIVTSKPSSISALIPPETFDSSPRNS